MKKSHLFFLLVCLLAVILSCGCAPQQAARCTSPEDTPQHHYLRGMEALEKVEGGSAQDRQVFHGKVLLNPTGILTHGDVENPVKYLQGRIQGTRIGPMAHGRAAP